MRRILVLLLVLCASTSSAADRRADQTKLRVMHLNAEFLWDGLDPEEGSADFPWKNNPVAARAHMEDVAEIIRAASPDILSLCEVEGIEALEMLNLEFLQGLGYEAFLVEGNDTSTGQDVGLLTRIDPISMERDDREGRSGNVRKRVSKNYVAEFEINDTKIALIGTHLLAFPTAANRKAPRQAQAAAISGMAIDEQTNGFLPIVLGDINDFDGVDRDHVDSKPVTNVLQRLRRMDASDDSDDLVSMASKVPQAQRFTAWHDANHNGQNDQGHELTSIDHMLMAPELASKVSSVQFLHDHDPTQHPDHFGILAQIDFGPSPSPLPTPPQPDFATARAAAPTAAGAVPAVSGAPGAAGGRFHLLPGQGDTKYVFFDSLTGSIWERVTVDGKDQWRAVEGPPQK